AQLLLTLETRLAWGGRGGQLDYFITGVSRGAARGRLCREFPLTSCSQVHKFTKQFSEVSLGPYFFCRCAYRRLLARLHRDCMPPPPKNQSGSAIRRGDLLLVQSRGGDVSAIQLLLCGSHRIRPLQISVTSTDIPRRLAASLSRASRPVR